MHIIQPQFTLANNELVVKKANDCSKVYFQNDHLGSNMLTSNQSGAKVEESNMIHGGNCWEYPLAPIENKEAYKFALELFADNPYHESLRNHTLKGRFTGERSIDITGDWRAIFKVTSSTKGIRYRFRHLGTHKKLYGCE